MIDKDNEDDEYHTEVPSVDVWENYAKLQDMGWTQQKIADVKGITQPLVGRRLKLHKDVPYNVKKIMCQGLIDEGHLVEIYELCVNTHLSPWLTTEDIRDEMVEKTITKIQKESATYWE